MIGSSHQLIVLIEISKREKVLRSLRPTSSCVLKRTVLMVFSVTPLRIDQNIKIKTVQYIKSRILKRKEGKYAKTLTNIQVTAFFLIEHMRRNFLPRFIEICIETPCWCPSSGYQPETNRNICH